MVDPGGPVLWVEGSSARAVLGSRASPVALHSGISVVETFNLWLPGTFAPKMDFGSHLGQGELS